MTPIPYIINNRQILYLDIQADLKELAAMDLKNWILFVIEDNKVNPVHWPFAELCIDKDVLYVCAAGKACSEMDDLFDGVMVLREINNKKLPSWMTTPDDVLMTTWDHNFDDGFWYVINVASYEEMLIDTILVVNLTDKNYLPIIEDLAGKINKGWLPPD